MRKSPRQSEAGLAVLPGSNSPGQKSSVTLTRTFFLAASGDTITKNMNKNTN